MKFFQKYLNYEDAHTIVMNFGLKSQSDWNKKYHELIRLKCIAIPRNPYRFYHNKWIGWGEWLGTNNLPGGIRKYTINHNYFKEWSPNMAYILGFWFADGCISSKRIFSIKLHKKDKYLLEKIMKDMGSNKPLYGVDRKYCCLSISSKNIYEDIVKLGGKERKSLDVEFPVIPQKYMSYFIRGLWDGDGSIFRVYERKHYKSSYTCGSKLFLEGLKNALCNNIPNLNPKIYERKNKLSKNKYYNMVLCANGTRMLRGFIYNDHNDLKLERKYEKFMESGNINSRFTHSQKTT